MKNCHLVFSFLIIIFSQELFSQNLKFGGTGSAVGTINTLAKAFNKKITLEEIPNLGSSGGIKAVEKGALDFSVTSRPLKPEELSQNLVEQKYAVSPFFVATSNKKITNIKMADLEAYYYGKNLNWPDGTRVRPVLRPKEDGDHALLASFSSNMKDALDKAHEDQNFQIASTDQVMADKIESLDGSLGTVTLSLILSENRKVNIPKLDGVAPSLENLKNGKYKFSKTLYIVTKSSPTSEVQEFLKFVQSKEGKKILAKTGCLVDEKN